MQANISGKTTFHDGKKWSGTHNARTEKAMSEWNQDGHINPRLTPENEILLWGKSEWMSQSDFVESGEKYCDLKAIFDQTFGDALVKFNNAQTKHPERVIGYSKGQIEGLREQLTAKLAKNGSPSEIAEVEKQLQQKIRDKAVSTYLAEQKKNIHESIVQLSDHKNFELLCNQVGEEKAREMHKEYLHRCVEDWQKNNPNLMIVGAAIHFDEATPHVHIDWMSVGHSNRGLTVKVSMDAALKEQGFEREKKKRNTMKHPTRDGAQPREKDLRR